MNIDQAREELAKELQILENGYANVDYLEDTRCYQTLDGTLEDLIEDYNEGYGDVVDDYNNGEYE